MSEGQPEVSSCAVCGRTILRGEQVSAYVTADGEPAAVCALCKDRAAAAGWVPAHLVGAGGGGDRGRGRARLRIRERLAPYGDRAREALSKVRQGASEATTPPPTQGPANGTTEVVPPVPAAPRDPSRAAIEIFNGSHERRKVAGLMRSLGEPRVSVHAPSGDHNPALITVAWELSWYQWEVGAGANREGVREVAKGGDISELSDPEPRWNASAREDGALALGASPGGA